MILSFIIDIVLFIITLLIKLITSVFPQFDSGGQLNELTTNILNFCGQGINFCNFIIRTNNLCSSTNSNIIITSKIYNITNSSNI